MIETWPGSRKQYKETPMTNQLKELAQAARHYIKLPSNRNRERLWKLADPDRKDTPDQETTTAKHHPGLPTAGPWRVSEHNGRRSIEAPCDYYPSKDGRSVVRYDNKFVYEIAELSYVNDEANAEFICKAVNCHEELLKALRRIERTDLSTVGPDWLGNFCRAAIAKAGGAL